jgi:hypothetical protein
VQSITIRFYIKANNTFDWTSKKGRAFKSSLSFHSTIVYRITDLRKFSRRNKFGTRKSWHFSPKSTALDGLFRASLQNLMTSIGTGVLLTSGQSSRGQGCWV